MEELPAREKLHISNFLNKSLHSYTEFEEKWVHVLVKFLTKYLGTLKFLAVIIIFILLWIMINLGAVAGIPTFDPYPFHKFIIITESFAVVLAIIVLISQNREAKINEVRQQMDFEINVRAENEITKILHMIEEIHTELEITKVDKELEQMKEKIIISDIKETVEQMIEEKDNTKGIT